MKMHDSLRFIDINDGFTDVFLGKKKTGSIVRVAGGFQYRPKGKNNPKFYGEVFASKFECKDYLL